MSPDPRTPTPRATPVPRSCRVILVIYVVFNLAIAASLMLAPGQVDAQYRGGPLTDTRSFQWFSIASFHLFMVAVTLAALAMDSARERRWIHLANAGFYAWDALSQALYWGPRIGVEPPTLATNVGVSALVGALLVFVWWRDRETNAARPSS